MHRSKKATASFLSNQQLPSQMHVSYCTFTFEMVGGAKVRSKEASNFRTAFTHGKPAPTQPSTDQLPSILTLTILMVRGAQ